MKKSALQQARAAYQPKLPKALQGAVKVKEGAPTQSVDNQEEIKALFPNTYGMPLIEFEETDEPNNAKFNVGVILSGLVATTSSLVSSTPSRKSTPRTVSMASFLALADSWTTTTRK